MQTSSLKWGSTTRRMHGSQWIRRAGCVAALWAITSSAHAASVFKCVDAHGATAYQDTPCATQVRQSEIDAVGQPLIDPNAPVIEAVSVKSSATHARNGKMRTLGIRAAKAKTPTSWECRAANGEVFYRHAPCPGSVPGDGVVRGDYAATMSRSRPGKRHDAWSRVSVRGEKVSRAEACRRIRGPSAAGRDGHQRDDRVSTYDRLTGHDPCSGA